jgi:hypothetical protein
LGEGYDIGADETPFQLVGVPTLLAPPDGTLTTTRQVTFTWAAGAGAMPEGYTLRLDGTLLTTTHAMTSTLLSTGLHTWTVRAYNANGLSNWADTWNIEIVSFTLYLPLVLRGD